MEIQRLLEIRLADAVRRAGPGLTGTTETIELTADELLLRPSQNPAFGDYQVNLAMPLGKRFGKPPRQVAEAVVANLEVGDLCEWPEIAGPGFINLRLRTEFLAVQIAEMVADERLGVAPTEKPLTIVIDYSSPNCAKPMHVGHIRSTVIGDALYKVLTFLGHRVISDNHIGDWGTQFGMILYGYKHFVDAAAYAENPVGELSRLYRVVRRVIDIQSAQQQLDAGEPDRKIAESASRIEPLRTAVENSGNPKEKDRAVKALRRAESEMESRRAELESLKSLVIAAESDAALSRIVAAHPDLNRCVQLETAKLHAGDPENGQLWEEFQPACRDEMERIYRRLHVTFDDTLGESFYQPMLAGVVDEAMAAGVAKETDGAVGIFFTSEELAPPASDVPIDRKSVV